MDLKDRIRQPYFTVFIDGRNEHGSHVLSVPGDNMTEHSDVQTDIEDQESGIAEKIIREAENMGHAVGHCVVTIWRREHGDVEYWEYSHVDPVLTELMCGSPEEQQNLLART